MPKKKIYLSSDHKKEIFYFVSILTISVMAFMFYLNYQINHTKSLMAEKLIKTYLLKEYRLTDPNIKDKISSTFFNLNTSNVSCSTNTNLQLKSETTCSLTDNNITLTDKSNTPVKVINAAKIDRLSFSVTTGLFDRNIQDFYKTGFKISMIGDNLHSPRGIIKEDYIADIINSVDISVVAKVKKINNDDVLIIFKGSLNGDSFELSISKKVLVRVYRTPKIMFL